MVVCRISVFKDRTTQKGLQDVRVEQVCDFPVDSYTTMRTINLFHLDTVSHVHIRRRRFDKCDIRDFK